MSPVLPGGTIGILGGGQLARMLALEGRRMGYRVAVLDPNPVCSAAQVADVCVPGDLDDLVAAKQLADQCDVVTLDTEHVPADLLEKLEPIVPVRPSAQVLRAVQDRLSQRQFLAANSVPQAPFFAVSTAEELEQAGRQVGFPGVLKTRRSGYDGKGQARVQGPQDLGSAWEQIGQLPAVYEAFVPFEREVSVLLARDLAGNIRFHPIAENDHPGHILRTSRVPARISEDLGEQAQAIGRQIANAFDYVGMMAIELFVTQEGTLLVNEIAPRTHNSGHYTFGSCATSQFEQHLRAVCGLALGDPTLTRPAVMLNVLGDLWQHGAPSWRPVLQHPNAHLHLYGKQGPAKGRKMGHVLVLGDDKIDPFAVAEQIAQELQAEADSLAPA